MYLSFIQIQNRAWAQAKATLERALLLEPTNASLLNSMGIVHRGLGEIDQAEKMYQDSYQYNPSNPEPLLNLAVLEADYRNDYQKAYTLLDRYLNEGGTEGDLVEQWRTEFQKSEKDFIAEKKRQEMRDLFKRRREEAAKKRAEEEVKQAEIDALEAASEEDLETTDEESGGMDENSNDESDEMDENSNDESTGLEVKSDDPNIESSSEDVPADNGWGTNNDSEEDSIEEDLEVQDSDEDDVENETDQGAQIEESVDEINDEVESTSDLELEGDTDDISVEEEPSDSEITNGEPEDISTEIESEEDSVKEVDPEDDGWGSTDDNLNEEAPAVPIEKAVEEIPEDVPDSDQSSWGDDAQSCETTADCEGDQVCSSSSTCLDLGVNGTSQEGDVCNSDNECGVELSCIDAVCTVDSE